MGKLEEGVKYSRLELAKFVGLTGFQDKVEVPMTPLTLFPSQSSKICLNAESFYVTDILRTRFPF